MSVATIICAPKFRSVAVFSDRIKMKRKTMSYDHDLDRISSEICQNRNNRPLSSANKENHSKLSEGRSVVDRTEEYDEIISRVLKLEEAADDHSKTIKELKDVVAAQQKNIEKLEKTVKQQKDIIEDLQSKKQSLKKKKADIPEEVKHSVRDA